MRNYFSPETGHVSYTRSILGYFQLDTKLDLPENQRWKSWLLTEVERQLLATETKIELIESSDKEKNKTKIKGRKRNSFKKTEKWERSEERERKRKREN